MTLSKLGPHLQRYTPDAQQWLEAGARLARLSGDLSSARVLAEVHPGAVLIGDPPSEVEVALDSRHGTRPEVSARAFVAAQRAVYDRHPQITAWQGPAAPTFGPATDLEALRLMAWYAAFEAERVRALAELGLRAVIGNFASGGPDLPLWAAFLPALDAAEAERGYLGLQEHSAPWLWWLAGPHRPTGAKAPDSTALAGWTTLRYRLVRDRALRPNGIEALPIVITSLRLDLIAAGDPDRPTGPWTGLHDFWSTYDGADDPIAYWQSATGDDARDPARYYAEQLIWYDAELQRDPEVLGAAVGIVGADLRHGAYELAGTSVSTHLTAHLRAARPMGAGSDGLAHAPRSVPRGPELPRLTRENVLDRRGFDEGWVDDTDGTQELAAPLGWRLRYLEGAGPQSDEAWPPSGRPFATLVGSPDVRPGERARLFSGAPFIWRVAARTPFHIALEQTVQGLAPGLTYAFSARVLMEPIVRDQPRVVYAPDQQASEVRASILPGEGPTFPVGPDPLATSNWLSGEALPFGRYGDVRLTFVAPTEAVTVRLEIRSRYALPLAAWHVQAPLLTPDPGEDLSGSSKVAD